MSSSDGELPPLLPGGTPSRRSSRASKRSRDSDNSSDSAFFSSDDLAEASVDRYRAGLRNKQYTKRSWYEPEDRKSLHSYQQMRSATRKPKDSGVYMNSDSSNSSADDGFALDGLKARIPSKLLAKKMGAFVKPARPSRPTDDSRVEAAVNKCLEDCCEKLDLSAEGLSRLSADIFLPLQRLIKAPRYDPAAFTEQALQPLIPDLQIFLFNNALERVPGSLFRLRRLKVLSLRNNRLTEIPPAIANLDHLVELNLAVNKLKFLPWTLLTLLQRGQIPSFRPRPNPFFRPRMLAGASNCTAPTGEDQEDSMPLPRRVGCTAVSFSQQCGTLHPASTPAPSKSSANEIAVAADPAVALRRQTRGNAPSLFELALRQCAQYSNLNELSGFIGVDGPDAVHNGLKTVEQHVYDGNSPCSVCNTDYVLARAEWIEFWQLPFEGARDSADAILPFLRRTCSWACAASAHD